MGASDRLTVLGIGAAIVTAVVSGTCSTNARIGDINACIDGLRTDISARIDGLRTDISVRIDDTNARIDRVETRLDGIDGRLRGVELAFGKVDQRLSTLERVLLPESD